jgi:hypothetical protein
MSSHDEIVVAIKIVVLAGGAVTYPSAWFAIGLVEDAQAGGD